MGHGQMPRGRRSAGFRVLRDGELKVYMQYCIVKFYYYMNALDALGGLSDYCVLFNVLETVRQVKRSSTLFTVVLNHFWKIAELFLGH